MKNVLIILALLCPFLFGNEQNFSLEITIVPILLPKKNVTAKFNGATLTMNTGARDAVAVPLDLKNIDRIRQAILAVPTKEWSGYWYSPALDGSYLIAKLEIDGKKFVFQGLNGCPPSFSNVLLAFHEVSKDRLFNGWEEKGKTAQRYESEEAFLKTTFKNHEDGE